MKKNRKGRKKRFLYLLCLMFTLSIIFSAVYLIMYKISEKNTNNQIEIIQNVVQIDEIEDSEVTEIIEQEHNQFDPYLDYTNMNLINVDFKNLKSINSDVEGWIQVNGTKINYPFVQGNNNKYYLTHSFDKSYNSSGWVFLDYRNDLSTGNDKNIILYAHNMNNKTMFGTLKNILSNGWLNNSDNHVIKLSTEHENTLWQVFSVYHIPTTSDYIRTEFYDEEDFKQFTNMLLNRSAYNFNTSVSGDSQILTLSTCYSKTERVVLHAKLIKRELR